MPNSKYLNHIVVARAPVTAFQKFLVLEHVLCTMVKIYQMRQPCQKPKILTYIHGGKKTSNAIPSSSLKTCIVGTLENCLKKTIQHSCFLKEIKF